MPKRAHTESTTEHKNSNLKLTDYMPVEPPEVIAPTPDEIQWIANKSSYYPFSEATGSDVVELRVRGTVMEPFLKGGLDSFSHSVSVDLSDEDVMLIRSYVYEIPNYNSVGYRCPIQVNAIKFTSKENVAQPFPDIWEISDEKLIRNEHLRSPVSYQRVKKGTPVWIEYTIIGYNGKEPTKEDPNDKFDPGVTFRLLSIGMLSGTGDDATSHYNFGSLKRRRAGETK